MGSSDTQDFMDQLGRRLKMARQEFAGWRRTQLASRLQQAGLDIDRQAMGRLERGERRLTAEELYYISQLLRVSSDWLIGITSDPHPAIAARRT